MSIRRRAFRACLCGALALVCGAAFAAPRLETSTPAEQAEAAPATPIVLKFSERLSSRGSGAELAMTSMPGMKDHPPMGMAVTVSVSADGRTLEVKPDQPLPRGSYRLEWQAAPATGKPVRGSLGFTIR